MQDQSFLLDQNQDVVAGMDHLTVAGMGHLFKPHHVEALEVILLILLDNKEIFSSHATACFTQVEEAMKVMKVQWS